MRSLLITLLSCCLSGCLTISAVYDSNGDPAQPPPTVNKWCEKISDGQTIACVNRSLGGGSATGCANSMETKFAQALADASTVIVMGLGTNDLGVWPSCVGTTPAAVVAALQTFESRTIAAGKTFWVATILPIANTTDQWAVDWNARIDATNAPIRTTFAHVVEVHDAFMAGGGPDASQFRADFVHLTDAGEQRLADTIRGAIL